METKAYLTILALVSAGSYFIGYSNRKIEVQEVVKEVVIEKQAEEKVVTRWRDRVVTKERIIHPDGTKEERVITENLVMRQELQKKKAEIEELKESQKKEILSQKVTMFSVGTQIPLKYPDLLPKSIECCLGASVVIGVRLLGPLWVEGGFIPEDKSASIGVRYEF